MYTAGRKMNKIPYAGKEFRAAPTKLGTGRKRRIYNKPVEEKLEIKFCLNCGEQVELSRNQRLCPVCRSNANNLSRYL